MPPHGVPHAVEPFSAGSLKTQIAVAITGLWVRGYVGAWGYQEDGIWVRVSQREEPHLYHELAFEFGCRGEVVLLAKVFEGIHKCLWVVERMQQAADERDCEGR